MLPGLVGGLRELSSSQGILAYACFFLYSGELNLESTIISQRRFIFSVNGNSSKTTAFSR